MRLTPPAHIITQPLALTPGTRLGVYEVTAQIGVGGMGEVYRATDTKLKRQVAIKILPSSLAADADRLARFQREAEVLASLNHPNIAAIHGLEESDGIKALVMELVEGPTLAEQIAGRAGPSGPAGLPLDEALPIARQIAEALEAAHEQGIIHRDLKPANIKVRADGVVKVLDFGLAKLNDPNASNDPNAFSQSPTITTPAMTQAGMILGTAAYMSPEQARGKTVDKRADIWAFGCVLYEMLTGQRAFPGEDITDTLAAVVRAEPEWSLVPRAVSPTLLVFLRRCLQKDPKQRVGDIRDVRLALEGAFETAAPQTATTASGRGGRPLPWMAALAVAVVLMVAMAVPTVRYLRETPPPPPPETRVDIVTPATDQPASFALSPDGRQIVFVASGDGASRLWLRSLATTTAQPLAGTEGAVFPFWSPDGRSIGFFAGGALKRRDVGGDGAGGAPQTLAPASNGRGGTWNANGVIVFAPSLTTPLMRVSATGGAAVAMATLGPQQLGHVAPCFLPDGGRFLFYVRGAPDAEGIYLGALDGSAATRVAPADSAGVYLPSGPGPAGAFRGGGWLLWVRAGTLVAQRLDVAKAALTGEPVTLDNGVAADSTFNWSAISVAPTGLVAYRTGGGSQRQLTWIDRSGTVQGTVGDPDATLLGPRVSPDGRRVAVARAVQGNFDLWLLDSARASRATFDATSHLYPIWSPDGARIVFRSGRTGIGDIYQKLASGGGAEESVVVSDEGKIPTSWSADGRVLLYHSLDSRSNGDLWVVPMVGDRTPSVFLRTPFREVYGEFSPDGRWVAYHSNESGRMEIYVRPFVPPGAADTLRLRSGQAAEAAGGQWQVSTAGGVFPVWSRDGKELYYLNPAAEMMAAPITVIGATLAPSAPAVLFPTRIYGGGVDVQLGRQYDVAPDGRFLINTELGSAAAPITLLMNWNPEAKK